MDARIVLDVRDLHHVYPGDIRVLYDLNIKVARGQIVSLVGPSGCGKSTLLRAVLGTQRPTRGSVITMRHEAGTLVERPVDGPGRDRGIVYQRYALFPHLTALDNVAVGLMFDQTTFFDRTVGYFAWQKLRRQHLDEAAAMLERVGLGHALHKHPQELSGGMQQRVAIAQALVMKPEILLLDEPFGALDEATREELQQMLIGFYHDNVAARQAGEEPPYTILIVTHELNEAIYVADRVLGLSQYWDWKGEKKSRSPGATIVYDKPAPIYQVDDIKDYAMFVEQKEEIRNVVFEPEVPNDRGEHVVFWDMVEAGEVDGILGPEMPNLTRTQLMSEALPARQRHLLEGLASFRVAVQALDEGDVAGRARVHAAEAVLRRRALEVLPPHPGHVPPREAVEAFCVGAWMLRHYERTVLGDRELIDTVGSRTLQAFRTDLDDGPDADQELREALRAAFELTEEDEARIDAVLDGELEALDVRHRIIEALDRRFGLAPAAPSLDTRVHALFSALYRGHPLAPGDVGLVRTGTSLFFTAPGRAEEADPGVDQAFLDRLHAFHDAQLGHFPVFGCFRGEGADPELLRAVAADAGMGIDAVAEVLTTMVTTLPAQELDKYLWHDLWGHQWQSHMLAYEDDFREMSRFRRWPDVTRRFVVDGETEVSLAGLVGDAACLDEVAQDHWDGWLDAVMAERLGVVASGMVSEILADVVEHKFHVLAPDASSLLPSSSLFRDQPTKLDLVLQDLFQFHAVAVAGLERLIAEPDGGDRLRAALRGVLPGIADEALDAALVSLRARCRARLDGPFRADLGLREGRVGVVGRIALNLLGLCATLEELYHHLESAPDPYPGPLRDFRDLMVLSAGAFHQLDPGTHFWHLDEYLGLHFEGCLRAFQEALAARR